MEDLGRQKPAPKSKRLPKKGRDGKNTRPFPFSAGWRNKRGAREVRRDACQRRGALAFFREARATWAGVRQVQRRALAHVGDPLPSFGRLAQREPGPAKSEEEHLPASATPSPLSGGWRNKSQGPRSAKADTVPRRRTLLFFGKLAQHELEPAKWERRRRHAANRTALVKQRGTTPILCTYMAQEPQIWGSRAIYGGVVSRNNGGIV